MKLTQVAVAAIFICAEFDSFSLYSWVTVSYLVTLIAAQPVYGRLLRQHLTPKRCIANLAYRWCIEHNWTKMWVQVLLSSIGLY